MLSGILVSESSLRDVAELDRARDDAYVRNLLVPSPAKLKKQILVEAQSIGDLSGVSMIDHEEFVAEELRQYVLRQTGSHKRNLAEEAAKMEASIARHLRFLRGLVLRYAKAFLLTIATTVVALAANGVLTLLRPIDGVRINGVNGEYVWVATLAIYAGWALVSRIIVRRPVIWLYADSSNDKINRTPRPLLRFEQITLIVTTLIAAIIGVDLFMVTTPKGGVGWILAAIIVGVIVTTFAVAGRAIVSERPERR